MFGKYVRMHAIRSITDIIYTHINHENSHRSSNDKYVAQFLSKISTFLIAQMSIACRDIVYLSSNLTSTVDGQLVGVWFELVWM